MLFSSSVSSSNWGPMSPTFYFCVVVSMQSVKAYFLARYLDRLHPWFSPFHNYSLYCALRRPIDSFYNTPLYVITWTLTIVAVSTADTLWDWVTQCMPWVMNQLASYQLPGYLRNWSWKKLKYFHWNQGQQKGNKVTDYWLYRMRSRFNWMIIAHLCADYFQQPLHI